MINKEQNVNSSDSIIKEVTEYIEKSKKNKPLRKFNVEAFKTQRVFNSKNNTNKKSIASPN